MKTRNTKRWIGALAAALLLAAGGYALYEVGLRHGRMQAATPAQTATPPVAPSAEGPEDATRRHMSSGLKAGDVDPSNGQKILYYHDPMVPRNKFDTPAKSPFMDMMLHPVYAGGTDAGQVRISPRIAQNLGVRTAPVSEGRMPRELRTLGSIAFNERDQVVVQARAAAFVEKLHVRATLDPVARGQALAELYVPDWIAAQEEFLAARRLQGSELAPALLDGTRARMRQAGMSEAQIALVDKSGRTQPRIALTAPSAGVLTELAAREGMAVAPGATLFRINGLATVWAQAEVPESQSALLRPGAAVQASTPSLPGQVFEGKVQAILPEVDPKTRTLKARMELSNPQGRLVPGMFVSMRILDSSEGPAVLRVPSEALVQTGRRTLVMLAEEDGRFRPAEVQAGMESDGQTEILRGLQAGQRVVVSSQFLIDSEASIKGVEARLAGEAAKGGGK